MVFLLSRSETFFFFLTLIQYKLHPKLVQDVQLVINELGMITVLWDEQWLSTLQDLHSGK